MAALYNLFENKHFRSCCIKSHKLTTILVTSLPNHAVIRARLKIQENDIVQTSVKAQILGRRYSKGNAVTLGKKRGILQFGQIQTIVWKDQQAYLFVKHMETIGFNSTVGAYNVKHFENNYSDAVFCLVATHELLDFHPLDISMPFTDHEMFIRLRYHVI